MGSKLERDPDSSLLSAAPKTEFDTNIGHFIHVPPPVGGSKTLT